MYCPFTVLQKATHINTAINLIIVRLNKFKSQKYIFFLIFLFFLFFSYYFIVIRSNKSIRILIFNDHIMSNFVRPFFYSGEVNFLGHEITNPEHLYSIWYNAIS